MRVIARVERPHPGAQLRITDHDGNRVTAFATNTRPGGPGAQIAALELRHRRRARCEDRIRAAKDTGLTNLPLHGFDANRIWCAVVQLACELIAWTQMLGFAEHAARRWEPKRLRLRPFATAASLAHHARVLVAHLAADHAWTDLVLAGRAAITGVPAAPADHPEPCPPDQGTPTGPWTRRPARARSPCPTHRAPSPPTPATEPRTDHQHQDHERSGLGPSPRPEGRP
jgi:hypothetical protein